MFKSQIYSPLSSCSVVAHQLIWTGRGAGERGKKQSCQTSYLRHFLHFWPNFGATFAGLSEGRPPLALYVHPALTKILSFRKVCGELETVPRRLSPNSMNRPTYTFIVDETMPSILLRQTRFHFRVQFVERIHLCAFRQLAANELLNVKRFYVRGDFVRKSVQRTRYF